MDSEFELFVAQHVNHMADSLEVLINKAAVEHDADYRVSIEDKSDAKYFVKQLIPHKPPAVSFMVIIMLATLMAAASQWEELQAIIDDPERLSDMVENLRGDDSSQQIISRLEKHHNSMSNKYKNVDVHGDTLKIADLGDVTPGGMSLN